MRLCRSNALKFHPRISNQLEDSSFGGEGVRRGFGSSTYHHASHSSRRASHRGSLPLHTTMQAGTDRMPLPRPPPVASSKVPHPRIWLRREGFPEALLCDSMIHLIEGRVIKSRVAELMPLDEYCYLKIVLTSAHRLFPVEDGCKTPGTMEFLFW